MADTDVQGLLAEGRDIAPRLVERAECSNEPAHEAVYFDPPEGESWYPPGCPLCQIDSLRKILDACHHRAWRRWRVTHWLARQAYASGLAAHGGTSSWSATHNWCLSQVPGIRGRRVYVLWVSVDWWSCLLRRHHVQGEPIGLGLCAKCAPCPGCGSKTLDHDDDCGWA